MDCDWCQLSELVVGLYGVCGGFVKEKRVAESYWK